MPNLNLGWLQTMHLKIQLSYIIASGWDSGGNYRPLSSPLLNTHRLPCGRQPHWYWWRQVQEKVSSSHDCQVGKVHVQLFSRVCFTLCIFLPCRNHQLSLDGSGNLFRRYLMLALLLVVVMATLIVLLTRVGRGVANRDPSLDWRHNPNLRTGD